MESRIIKFRLIHKGKIFGYEKLTENGWESMCPFLNPEGGERWTPVVFSNSIEGIRHQFTGHTDKDDVEAYEKDYDEDGNMIDFCERCSGYQFFQIDIPSKDVIFCHNCEGHFMLQDHIRDFKIIGNLHIHP